jgi:hypothetical protein
MGWMVRGSNPGGDEVSRTCPDWQWGSSSHLFCMGGGSSAEVKRPGHSINHTLPPRAGVKERVELYVYSPLWTFKSCSLLYFIVWEKVYIFNNFMYNLDLTVPCK